MNNTPTPMNERRRRGWRRITVATLVMFAAAFSLLNFRLATGHDPLITASTASTQTSSSGAVSNGNSTNNGSTSSGTQSTQSTQSTQTATPTTSAS